MTQEDPRRLMRVLDADKVVVEQGDMVLLHTGFDEVLLEMEKRPDPALVAIATDR